MSEQEAVRRLVKSGPELWAQCSDPLSLSKHLAAFGEITITRSDPESAVAWEGESVRGTVSLEPAGWGTRVRLTAVGSPAAGAAALTAPIQAEPERTVGAAESDAGVVRSAPEADAVQAPEPTDSRPAPVPTPRAAQSRRFGALLSSLLNRRRGAAVPPAVAPETAVPETAAPLPTTELEPEPMLAVEPEPAPEPAETVTAAVTQPLDLVAELEAALDSLGAAHHRPYSRS